MNRLNTTGTTAPLEGAGPFNGPFRPPTLLAAYTSVKVSLSASLTLDARNRVTCFYHSVIASVATSNVI